MYPAHSVCRLPTVHGVCRIHLFHANSLLPAILKWIAVTKHPAGLSDWGSARR